MRVIRAWILPHNGFRTISVFREYLRAFLLEHPDVKVEVKVRTAASLWKRLFQSLKRPQDGERPDLVEIPHHWTSGLADLGLLEDLAEIDPELDLGGWLEPCRDHCRLAEDGPGRGRRVFSLPWWMGVRVLLYRKDVFRRHGLKAEEAVGSWESLARTCRWLAVRRGGASQGLYPIANSNQRESVSLADVAAAVWSRGGDFFSRDGSRAVFHRDEAFGGVRDYIRMLDEGWMPMLGKTGLVARDLFDGGCLLQFSGRFRLKDRALAPGLAGRIGAVLSPRGLKGRSTILTAHHLAVVRGCAAPREAYGLLRHLLRPNGGRGYAQAIGALPCVEGEWARLFQGHEEIEGVFREALRQARALPNMAMLGTLERVFDRSMENLMRAILRKSYGEELLRRELIYAAAEMDYILSFHAEKK